MEYRVSLFDDKDQPLNSVIMQFGDPKSVAFYKQIGEVNKYESVVITEFMKDRKPEKIVPIHPRAKYMKLYRPTGELLYDLTILDEQVINNLVKNMQFFKTVDRLYGAPVEMVICDKVSNPGFGLTEPLDISIKTGMNLVIQEDTDEQNMV